MVVIIWVWYSYTLIANNHLDTTITVSIYLQFKEDLTIFKTVVENRLILAQGND